MPTLDGTYRRPHYSSVYTDYKGVLQHKISTAKNYLSCPHKVICSNALVDLSTPKWLGFLCLASTPLKPKV